MATMAAGGSVVSRTTVASPAVANFSANGS
ncbi:hypothetical protein O973_15795 [Mycobacterium avium subsp. avium 11-4751]|nr:hypothetical protein O973_15795 [Mycobacterium avium subsp. avium 11-4751]